MLQLQNKRIAGHLGRETILNYICRRFSWSDMSSDVKRWCTVCAQRNPGPGLGKSPMQHRSSYQPLQSIAIDIMGPLPISETRNQYIMVISDYFTKWKEAFALQDHSISCC